MVEMVVVIAVTAIIAATLAVTIRPTVDAYAAVKGRADLTDQADAAMRRIVRAELPALQQHLVLRADPRQNGWPLPHGC